MTPRPVRRAKDQTSYEHVEWAKQEASSAIWSLYGGQTAARRGAAARALLSLWGNHPIITRNHPGNHPVGPSGVITPWGNWHPRSHGLVDRQSKCTTEKLWRNQRLYRVHVLIARRIVSHRIRLAVARRVHLDAYRVQVSIARRIKTDCVHLAVARDVEGNRGQCLC